MNSDTIEGNWKQIRGVLKKEWGDLTDQPETEARGNMDRLVGKLQEKFGMARDEAADKVNTFLDEIGERDRS